MNDSAVCPLEPHFRGQHGQRIKNWNALDNRKWSSWNTLSRPVNLFEICWIVVETLRREHGPKWTRLCDLLLTWSSWWLHFQSECKSCRMLLVVKLEVPSSSSFRDVPEINVFVTAESVAEVTFTIAYYAKYWSINVLDMTSLSASIMLQIGKDYYI